MKKTTIFDFVQNPQNEGINWHLNFLVDYLPLIDRMFDKVVFDLKNNKANLVDNTELVDFWNKIAQPNSNTGGCLVDQLDVGEIDMSIFERYQQDDPFLEDLTLSDAIQIQNTLRKIIRKNRKVVIADILLGNSNAGKCYFYGYSNLKDISLLVDDFLLPDYQDLNQYDIFQLEKVAEKFESTKLDSSLPKSNISIIIYNDKDGNWSLQPQHGSQKVKIQINKFEVSHAVAFEEVDRLKQQYDFSNEFLANILELAREKFDKNYWNLRVKDDKSDFAKVHKLKEIIKNADWNSNLSLLWWKKSDSYYYQKHSDKINSIYLSMVPSNVLNAARELHDLRKRHEFDVKWDFNSTKYRKIVIRLSDHPNEGDYDYDLDYDDFIRNFNLEKIKNNGLSHKQMQQLDELIDDGDIEENY